MLNKVQIIGRLTKDVEKVGDNDVYRFSVATSRTWKNKEGEKQEETEFVNFTAFGKMGETIMQYMHKGDMQYFEGRLQTRKVGEGEDTKYYTGVVLESFSFLPNGKKEGSVNTDTSKASAADISGLPF